MGGKRSGSKEVQKALKDDRERRTDQQRIVEQERKASFERNKNNQKMGKNSSNPSGASELEKEKERVKNVQFMNKSQDHHAPKNGSILNSILSESTSKRKKKKQKSQQQSTVSQTLEEMEAELAALTKQGNQVSKKTEKYKMANESTLQQNYVPAPSMPPGYGPPAPVNLPPQIAVSQEMTDEEMIEQAIRDSMQTLEEDQKRRITMFGGDFGYPQSIQQNQEQVWQQDQQAQILRYQEEQQLRQEQIAFQQQEKIRLQQEQIAFRQKQEQLRQQEEEERRVEEARPQTELRMKEEMEAMRREEREEEKRLAEQQSELEELRMKTLNLERELNKMKNEEDARRQFEEKERERIEQQQFRSNVPQIPLGMAPPAGFQMQLPMMHGFQPPPFFGYGVEQPVSAESTEFLESADKFFLAQEQQRFGTLPYQPPGRWGSQFQAPPLSMPPGFHHPQSEPLLHPSILPQNIAEPPTLPQETAYPETFSQESEESDSDSDSVENVSPLQQAIDGDSVPVAPKVVRGVNTASIDSCTNETTVSPPALASPSPAPLAGWSQPILSQEGSSGIFEPTSTQGSSAINWNIGDDHSQTPEEQPPQKKLEPAPWQEHQQKTQEPAKQEASPWGQQDPWSAPAKAESSSDGWSAPAKAESYSDGWSAPAKAESSSDGWSSQSQPKTNQGGWGVTPSSSFAPWNKSISQQKTSASPWKQSKQATTSSMERVIDKVATEPVDVWGRPLSEVTAATKKSLGSVKKSVPSPTVSPDNENEWQVSGHRRKQKSKQPPSPSHSNSTSRGRGTRPPVFHPSGLGWAKSDSYELELNQIHHKIKDPNSKWSSGGWGI